MLICFMFFSVIIIKVTPCNICLADKFKKKISLYQHAKKPYLVLFRSPGVMFRKYMWHSLFQLYLKKKLRTKDVLFLPKNRVSGNLTKLLDGVNCQQQFYLQQTRSSSYLQQRKISDVIKTAEAKTRVFQLALSNGTSSIHL